jgi:hypothetical protein
MHLLTVRAQGSKGVELEYILLVEAHRENGRSKRRGIANLGRKDLLAPHLESLIELAEHARFSLPLESGIVNHSKLNLDQKMAA